MEPNCIRAYNKFVEMVEKWRLSALPYMPWLSTLTADECFDYKNIDRAREAYLQIGAGI